MAGHELRGEAVAPHDFLPRDVSDPWIQSGELEVALPELAVPVPMYVAWVEREFTPPAVRAFVDLAVELLGAQ